MKLSKHAQIRSKQRGISRKLIRMIIDHGNPVRGKEGAQLFRITKRDKNKIISEYKHEIQFLEKSSNLTVVVSTDGEIVTAYHDY